MPYVSERQRRFMHFAHPGIAARWDKKYGGKIKPRTKKQKEGFLSMLTTKAESLDQKASKIRKAVYDELRPKPQPAMAETYGYIRDVYEDHVIYCEGEHDWKVPFATDAEGDIETAPRDEWTEVEQTWTEVKSLREFIVRLKAGGKRGAKAPLGQGGRFAALEAKIAARGKVSNPAAVAAAIGRNKYGAGRMAKLSARGRKQKEITLKFNRLHDKLGHFARKVGGALRPSAAHRARKAEGIAALRASKTAIKRGISGTARRPAKPGSSSAERFGHLLGRGARGLAKASTVGHPAVRVGRAILRKVRRSKTGVRRGLQLGGRAVGRHYANIGRFGRGLAYGAAGKEFQIPAVSFVFKENDTYRWALLSSNGFRDKDGEIVSTKALERDVAQWELAGAPAQPLRFWHIPLVDDYSRGLEIGTCDFRMVQGHTLIESGTFLTKEIGEAVYNNQDKLAASLGFRHSPLEPDSDKIFNTIRTFERSLLPKESASNALTYLAAYTPQGV